MSSQNVMTYPIKRPGVALPYAFTEQGVTMLSRILNSDKAIKMNIAINACVCTSEKDFINAERCESTNESINGKIW